MSESATPPNCAASWPCPAVSREINLYCVVDDTHPVESCLGTWVLVHVGFAMSRINEAEAARTLQVLAELGEMQRELDAMHGSPDVSYFPS